MPITYTIDREKRVVYVVWRGDITADELARHWTDIVADRDAMAQRRSLADLRGANLLFSGAELSRLVETILVPAIAPTGWKAAHLVAQTSHFGMSRQFHVFAGLFSQDTIFFDRETALAWLLAD